MNVLYFHKCRCYRGMVANVFGQFVEATERRGERGFRGSKTVLKLEYRGTCLGCSQVGHHNASLPTLSGRIRWSDLFFSSPSWWRQLTWTPGKTTLWASIPTACWWQEPLPTSAPMLQASDSCFLASPATCSCCPFGSEPRSSETTSCLQVWARDVWILLHQIALSL